MQALRNKSRAYAARICMEQHVQPIIATSYTRPALAYSDNMLTISTSRQARTRSLAPTSRPDAHNRIKHMFFCRKVGHDHHFVSRTYLHTRRHQPAYRSRSRAPSRTIAHICIHLITFDHIILTKNTASTTYNEYAT